MSSEEAPLQYDTECFREDDERVDQYIRSTRSKLLFILFLTIVCIISSLYSMTIYGDGMSIPRLLEVISAHISGVEYPRLSAEWFEDITVWDAAMPRLIFTVIAGIGLAVAGASMQSCMNNPLADPYTVGVSSGACLGLSIALLLGFSVNNNGLGGIIIFAFLFSLLPLLAIVLLSPKTRSSPATLILAGVALSYLFNSMNTIIMVAVDAETLESIYSWQVGTLTQIRWDNIPFVLFAVGVGSAIILSLSKRLNLLALGDEGASSLGIDPDNLRLICLTAIAFIVGAVVGSAGVIGFIGLVTPHIVRSIIGSDNKYVLPAASMLGITLMAIADTACRYLDPYDNIPVGTAISLIGAPIFLYLIMRRKSRVW
ncbi:MAG: iron ABC transporter permease [Candidatus Methanomethylophilaceae archaeon]|nr:iron ABC transporter permease [Candidatus Methanomethylophilaceae archaeon]MDY5871740.1 iron ABC transporter permease [Candidatus Methanomethylophilaceae archaeon]